MHMIRQVINDRGVFVTFIVMDKPVRVIYVRHVQNVASPASTCTCKSSSPCIFEKSNFSTLSLVSSGSAKITELLLWGEFRRLDASAVDLVGAS